jgi:hypothetical protein
LQLYCQVSPDLIFSFSSNFNFVVMVFLTLGIKDLLYAGAASVLHPPGQTDVNFCFNDQDKRFGSNNERSA